MDPGESTMPLRVGVAKVALEPPLGWPMMGYGARKGTATETHDPLYARALFAAGGEPAGVAAGSALLIEIDVCLLGVGQARALRARIAACTGLRNQQVMVGSIHTHSGPETGLMRFLLDGRSPPEVEPLFDRAVEAATAAVAAAEPAQLAVTRVPVSIGRNRRVASGPVERDAVVLRVDRERDGSPLAVLYVHGCHPTVLGHDNLAYSADWPGAASRVIERALPGALAIFALGAHADVDPRTRGLLDLAIPDQSVGVGFDEMEALGREVGEAVAKAALGLETRTGALVGAALRKVRLATHPGDCAAQERTARLQARRTDALAALGLPADAEASTADFYRLEAERTRGLPANEVRERLSRVRLYLRDRTARRIAGGDEVDVEVQVLRLGELWLLGLPLEVTVDVGRAWQDAVGEHAALISIANGWLRYLPHATHFEEPLADQKYEILQSTFVPEAAEALVSAAVALRTRMMDGSGEQA